ncbi:MAG: 23S rRNA (uracil(1939)-C(5))-methyltransferase RlmD, partial [Firmicutes bacterium HGW-Firmicutes-13]
MEQKIPLTKGQVIRVTIDNLNHQGEGVTRYKNFVLFVPGGVPGDELLVEILSIKKNFARSRINEILNASPARIKPHCKHFPECGGCQLQHIDYSEQLKYKTRMVREAVRRIGSISENTVKEITGMEHTWHYRNKAQFPVGQQDNIIKIGYYAPGSHTLVDVDHCLIQHKLNNKVLKVMKEIIKKYNLSVYHRKTGKGLIRHIGSKVSSCTGEVMVLLVTNGKKLPHQEKIVEKLRQEIPELVSIVQNINTRKGNIILGDQDILLYGKPQITESIGELKYNISSQAFFQVNFSQTKVLYDKILNYA